MIMQVGLILGTLGLVREGVTALFPRNAPRKGFTPAEFSEILRAEARLEPLGERARTTIDPFTGGNLLFRSSQELIPGLVEQLAFEAAVRRGEQAFVQTPEFLSFQRDVLREREAPFVPVQQDFERTEVVRLGVAKEPIGPMMVPNRVTKRPVGREVVQEPALTLAGPCAGATTAASRAACAQGGFV